MYLLCCSTTPPPFLLLMHLISADLLIIVAKTLLRNRRCAAHRNMCVCLCVNVCDCAVGNSVWLSEIVRLCVIVSLNECVCSA